LAACSARSKSRTTTALIGGSSRSMCEMASSASSTALISRAASAAMSCPAVDFA
jgi:hypothetical protein